MTHPKPASQLALAESWAKDQKDQGSELPGSCCHKGLLDYRGAKMLRARPLGAQGIYPSVDKAQSTREGRGHLCQAITRLCL